MQKKALSMFLAILMVLTSTLSVLGAPFYEDQTFVADESLRGGLITYGGLGGDEGWDNYTPAFVKWTHPVTGAPYYAYCVNPAWNGQGDGGTYKMDIVDLLDETTVLGAGGSGGSGRSGATLEAQVWGAIQAGFPNKTAAELGLSNNYQAYVATKLAIWSLIYPNYSSLSGWKEAPLNSNDIKKYTLAEKSATLAAMKQIAIAAKSFNMNNIPKAAATVAKKGGVQKVGGFFIQEYQLTVDGGDEQGYNISLKTNTANAVILDSADKVVASGSYIPKGSDLTFKIKAPIPTTPDYDIKAEFSIDVRTDLPVAVYAEPSDPGLVGKKQNYVLYGQASVNSYGVFEAKDGVIPEDGELVINKKDGTGKALIGAVFSFTDASGTPTPVKDADGKDVATLTETAGVHKASNLPYGTYYIKETTVPAGYTSDGKVITMIISDTTTSKTVDVANAPTTTTPPPVTPPPSTPPPSGDISKEDAITGKGLDGVTFDLYNSTGQLIESGTTTGGGKWSPKNIDKPGTYTVIERSTNPKYQLTEPTTQVFTVPADTMFYSVKFRDFEWQIVTIYKEDGKTGKPIPGVQYQITQIDGKGAWKAVGQTDAQGRIVWTNVPDGVYTVHEVSTVDGYILDPTPQTVTVRNGMAPSLKFLNNKFPGLSIMKQDKQSGTVVTEPATFHVEQINGTYTADVSTVNGVVVLENIPVGSYKITEKSAPNGYVLDSEPATIQLNAGESKTYIKQNLKTPVLLIEKVDKQTGKVIPGTKFEIKKDGVLIGTVTTGQDGKATVGMKGSELGYLQPGLYSVTETFVPAPYILPTDGSQHQDVMLSAGETKSLIFYDLEMPTILIEKYDEKTLEKLPNAEFGIYRQEDLSRPVYEGITDKDGKITTGKLMPGTYVIKEINPPPGYMFSDKTESKRTIVLQGGDGVVVVKFDNIKLPELIIKKIDKITQKPMAGFTFSVVQTDDTSAQPSTAVTDANGLIKIPGLKAGTYTVTEIAGPSDYIIDKTPQNVQMNGGDTKTLLFQNIKLPTLVVLKTDYETNNPIPNTTYEIKWEDPNGGVKLVGTYKTNTEGRIVLPSVQPGWFQITETIPAQGFQAPTNPTTRIFLEAGDNSYTSTQQGNVGGNDLPDGVIITSGKDYPVVAGIVNYPLNSLIIKKADQNTGEMLSGATFEVIKITGQTSGQNGNVVATVTSDSSGTIIVTGLVAGAYAVKEIKAPANYLIAETNMQTVNLKADGTSVVEVMFRNIPSSGISIDKVDGATGLPLAGATFKVTDNAGAVIGNNSYTTDAQGNIIIPNVMPGSYVITELTAPKGYAIDTTPQTVLVGTDGKIYKASFTNYPEGTVLIRKYDQESKAPLSGAIFKVTDAAGAAVGEGNGEYTTDATGVVKLPQLAKGAYNVTEIKAPDGYALSEKSTQTILVDYSKTYSVDFYNARKGTLVVSKYDEASKAPLAGAKFKITHSDGSVVGNSNGEYTTDATGKITIPLTDKGSYIVTEIKAPDGYAISEKNTQTIVVDDMKTYNIDFYNQQKGTLVVTKYDADTKAPLAGAVFKMTKLDGSVVGNSNGEYTTDASGKITIPLTEKGSYLVTEIKAPDGYAISEKATQTIVVDNMKIYNVDFYNEPKGTLVVTKYEEDTKVPLANAVFKITKADGSVVGNSNGEYTTDASGKITIPLTDKGTYIVTEHKAPNGYAISDKATQTIVVDNIKTYNVDFYNAKLKGIVIQKLDSQTNQPLANAQFEVWSTNETSNTSVSSEQPAGQLIGTYTTDNNGTITIGELRDGNYLIKEVKAPTGYQIDGANQVVTVNSSNPRPTTVTFYNTKIMGIIINKIDQQDNKPLNGAEFEVKTSTGEIVGKFTTDSNGSIDITKDAKGQPLPSGTYIVTETKAPNGYMINETPKTITVTAGQKTTVTFKNQRLEGLTIRKIDSQTKQPLPGAMFEVWNASSSSNTSVSSGSPAGNLVGTYTTDVEGLIEINTLPNGTYTVKEIKAPEGYQLDNASQQVTIGADKTTTVTFSNTKIEGLEIIKIDSQTKQPLPGAKFQIRNIGASSNTSVSSGTPSGEVIGEYTTDAHGIIRVALPSGFYEVIETQAPSGYQIDNAKQDVVIAAGKVTTVTFSNTKVMGLIITKVDSKTQEPLQGATFEIRTPEGTLQGTYVTDRTGSVQVPGIPSGVYVITETIAPYGYDLDSLPQTVTVKAGVLSTVKFTDNKLATIIIKKLDKSTNQPLEGAKFDIVTSTGERVATFTTDKEGLIHIPYLAPGTYWAKETEAPKGYNIAQPVMFDVKDTTSSQYSATNKPKIVGLPSDIVVTIYDEPLGVSQVIKTNSVTGKPVKGATYQISALNSSNPGNGQTVQAWGKASNGQNIRNNGLSSQIGQYTTDQFGIINITNLQKGWYTIQEISAPMGYELDASIYNFEMTGDGVPTVVQLTDTPIMGRIALTKISQDYNNNTGWDSGTPLEGAVYDILDVDGIAVDTITTGADGTAISKPIILGTYTLKEVTPPDWYGISTRTVTATIARQGQTVSVTDKDPSINLNLGIKKTSDTKSCTWGDIVNYYITGVGNESNVPLDNFTVHDKLPEPKIAQIQYFDTGMWSKKYNFKFSYATNMKTSYTELPGLYSSDEHHQIDLLASNMGLRSGEYVTQVKMTFQGSVTPGFKLMEAMSAKMKVQTNIPNNYQFTNYADVTGRWKDQIVTANSHWTITVYYQTKGATPAKPLPKTGY